MDPEYGYLGVPDEVVVELGRIVVVAGRVENVGHEIAGQLGLHANWQHDSWDRLSNEVRRRVNALGLPACSAASADEVKQWFSEAQKALGRRNVCFHATRYRVVQEGEWHPQAQHIKTGEVNTDTVAALAEVRSALEESHRAGYRIFFQLIHGGKIPHDPYRQGYPACR